MPKRKFRQSRTALDKVLSMFNQISGKTDNRFDTAYSDRNKDTYKILCPYKHNDIFRKCIEFDFEYLLGRQFSVPKTTLQHLLPQSLLGRAQNGHGWFIDDDGIPLKFPQTSFDHICTVLEHQYPHLSNLSVRSWRNHQIDRLNSHILMNIESDTMILEDIQGPLFDIGFLQNRTVSTRSLLKGMILAGRMDTYSFRHKMLRKYPNTYNNNKLTIGGGQIYITQSEKYKKTDLYNHQNEIYTTKQINKLISLDIIHNIKATYHYPTYDQNFFRLRAGNGISDDLAMLYIGNVYGFDALLGAFLMDAIDTYDKFLMTFYPGGMDHLLTNRIVEITNNLYETPLVDHTEIYKMIHFAAKDNTPSTALSSSHRRLIQTEDGSELPTLLHHWAFLKGEKLNTIKLGFNRTPSDKFYNLAAKRFKSIGIEISSKDNSL